MQEASTDIDSPKGESAAIIAEKEHVIGDGALPQVSAAGTGTKIV